MAIVGYLVRVKINILRLISVLKSVTPIITFILLIYTFTLPALLNQLIAINLNLHLLIAAILVFPCGFLLGFPFPLNMRLLKIPNHQSSISRMRGINELAPILGSVLAIIFGISFSFSVGLILGTICYLAIFFSFWDRCQPEFYGYNKIKDIKLGDYIN